MTVNWIQIVLNTNIKKYTVQKKVQLLFIFLTSLPLLEQKYDYISSNHFYSDTIYHQLIPHLQRSVKVVINLDEWLSRHRLHSCEHVPTLHLRLYIGIMSTYVGMSLYNIKPFDLYE